MTPTLATAADLETRSVEDWRTVELEAYVGGLSRPGKMPGYAYSLPAAECQVGGSLQKVEGSVCHGCYAMKGRYGFPVVQSALYRRLASIERPLWSAAMAELIRRKGETYFRWHDSGDIQSTDHLAAICEVAAATPEVRHWIPTREYRIVAEYRKSGGVIPPNLAVRLSAHMVDGTAPQVGLPVSEVFTDAPSKDAHRCPAPEQGNQCGDCRACWDPTVEVVAYHLH